MAAGGLGDVEDEPAWRAFVEHVVETLDVGPGTRVWDVGCGAGAFLFPLWENGYVVGGVDPSATLIARARVAMPEGHFVVGPVRELNPDEASEVVVASGGLAGCADMDQVRGVLARMAAKATHAIAVLRVNESEEGEGPVLDRARMLRMLAEIGVTAIQFEEAAPSFFNVFARI